VGENQRMLHDKTWFLILTPLPPRHWKMVLASWPRAQCTRRHTTAWRRRLWRVSNVAKQSHHRWKSIKSEPSTVLLLPYI